MPVNRSKINNVTPQSGEVGEQVRRSPTTAPAPTNDNTEITLTLPDGTKTKAKQIAKEVYDGLKDAGLKVTEDIFEIGSGLAKKFYRKVKDAAGAVVDDVSSSIPSGGSNPSTNSSNPNDLSGFASCVAGIPGVYVYNNQAVFTDNGIIVKLNKDGGFEKSDGTKGKYTCGTNSEGNPNLTLQISQGGKVTNNQSQTVNGTFPDCVTGLKKYDDYYFGTATDENNNQYKVGYYSTPKKTSDFTDGYRAVIWQSSTNKATNAVYLCMGDEIEIISWDGNIRLTADSTKSNTDESSTLAEIDNLNDGGLELWIPGTKYFVNSKVINPAVETVVKYINVGYRGEYFGNFYDMLVKLKEFADSINRTNDSSYLSGKISQIDNIKESMKNKAAKLNNLDWNSLSNPDNTELGSYEQPKQINGVNVYQLKGQGSTRQDIQSTDERLKDLIQSSTIDEKTCKSQLEILIDYAGRNDLLKGSPKTVNVSSLTFSTQELQTLKFAVSKCNSRRMYGKKERDALNFLSDAGTNAKYRVNFGAENSSDEPTP